MIRKSALAILVALASVLLVGCEQVLEHTGNVSIRRDGSDLLIATCDPLTLEEFVVSARSRSNPFAKSVRLVTLFGSGYFESGHIYRVGDEVAGMKFVDSNAVDLDDLRDIAVEAGSPSPPYNPLFREWDLEKVSIPDNAWLMPNGSTASEPCPQN